MRRVLRYSLAPVAAVAALVGTALPASAFDCTNPARNEHAPTAGVNYTLLGFDGEDEPILEQTGPGQGIGGWVAITPGLFGNEDVEYTSPHNVVGGPGSQKPEHACDGKGIDYLEC